MSSPTARASRGWLALREPADAAARSEVLVQRLRGLLPDGPLTIHDLGSGTGSMRRWLAPKLPGPQTWIEHDRDAALLRHDPHEAPTRSHDGQPVTVRTSASDLASLDALTGASLVTASALLDVLTADGLDALVELVVAAGVPCLLTLSVVGRVELEPTDPLDVAIQEAFNDHQRRTTDIGALLGPNAVNRAAQLLPRRGMQVWRQPSPWLLGPERSDLLSAWFEGWVEAAREQDHSLRRSLDAYVTRRRQQAREGHLRAAVHHLDLLAWPS